MSQPVVLGVVWVPVLEKLINCPNTSTAGNVRGIREVFFPPLHIYFSVLDIKLTVEDLAE